MINDFRSLLRQSNVLLTWLFAGALMIGFSHNDVLPNNTSLYITFMNSVMTIGFIIVSIVLVHLCNVDDAVNKATFDWRLTSEQSRQIKMMDWLQTIIIVFAFIIIFII